MSETAGPEVTFETAMKRLEEIVQRLERGELPLEESLSLYEEGTRLSRLCHTRLDEAEGRIDVILKDARGEAALGRDGQVRTAPLARDEKERP